MFYVFFLSRYEKENANACGKNNLCNYDTYHHITENRKASHGRESCVCKHY